MPERFPAEVAAVLRSGGWSEGRRADAQVAAMVEVVRGEVGRFGARIEPFPAATEALSEFGGVYVVQDGPGHDLRRRPFAIDPTQVATTTETLADLGKVLETTLFPIGMEGDHDSVLAIDQGRPCLRFRPCRYLAHRRHDRRGLHHAGQWHAATPPRRTRQLVAARTNA